MRLLNTDTIRSAAVAGSTARWVILSKVAPEEYAAALLGLGVIGKQSKPAFALIAKGLELRHHVATYTGRLRQGYAQKGYAQIPPGHLVGVMTALSVFVTGSVPL